MSDREILLRWLATVAQRLGWRRRLPEIGRLVCALVGLRLLAEVLRTLGVPEPVRAAFAPLLILTGLAVLALYAWRLSRPLTLAQAASAADRRAGLKDEIRSAHWFAQQAPARDAPVDRLLARAAQTAQRLDARRLIPLGVPRNWLAALALAICTVALAWVSPHIALPLAHGPGPTAASAERAATAAAGAPADQKPAAGPRAPEAPAQQERSSAWSQLEQLAQQLPAGADQESLREALAARDAPLAARLAQSLERAQTGAAPRDPGAGAGGERMAAETLQGLLDRLRSLMQEDAKPAAEPTTGAKAQAAARVTQEVRQEAEEEKRRMTGTPAQGDVEYNPRLRAASRNGASMRKVAYATGEVADAGTQTSVDGVAMGPPDGKGRAGGTSGEHPQSSPAQQADTQPVLGEPTVPLEVQLQKVRIERADEPQQEGRQEAFYAATQHQASQVGIESVATRWRAQPEAALVQGRTPLGYREAVKRYFLTRHAEEAD